MRITVAEKLKRGAAYSFSFLPPVEDLIRGPFSPLIALREANRPLRGALGPTEMLPVSWRPNFMFTEFRNFGHNKLLRLSNCFSPCLAFIQ